MSITPQGIRMHNILGRRVRENYPGLFGPEQSLFDAQVYSSYHNRTLYSADAHMKGLYPEDTGLKIPKEIEFSKLLNPPMESKNADYSNIEGEGALKYRLGSSAIFSNTIGKDELFHKNLEKYCPFLYRETTQFYKHQVKKTSRL